MRLSRILICLSFLTLPFIVFSQRNDTIMGKVVIIQDQRIDDLLDKHLQYCQNYLHIPGYRIQIYFDSGNYSKKGALNAKALFLTKYPNVAAYIIFQEPYYKVRVGDFRTKMEAEGFLEKIKYDFPNAYRVNDNINFPEIN
jgi:hypothetical protein